MAVPVIIGAGLAGLATALAMAPKPVVVLGRKPATGMTSSELAQGGIAAAVGNDDSLGLHEKDTLAAGAGLCDPKVVRSIIEAGPKAIERLSIWGVAFDRTQNQDLLVGLEGAHSRRRIVHAQGDSTGSSVMKAIVARVAATSSIQFIDDVRVSAITTDEVGVTGVTYFNVDARVHQHIKTDNVILCTGSACALWRHTTVPHASWGHGLLLAAQAGAILRDLEFVQFHPTALDVGLDPMPLISEALRGEGARLVNEKGDQFVGELNPRDIVARAIWAEIERGQKVYLDARNVEHMRTHFPTILQACLNGGLDPREELIPIRPVAHYTMGGVATDIHGRSNVKGLYACGEIACTGLHGANRLASNSLLEAVVMGCRIGDHLRGSVALNEKPTITSLQTIQDHKDSPEDILRVRSLMMSYVGVRRQGAGLEEAITNLTKLSAHSMRAKVALMTAKAALERTESRGSHERKDFPALDPAQARSITVALRGKDIVLGTN